MKGSRNSAIDHLPKIYTEYTDDLDGFFDHFSNQQLHVMSHSPVPWFAHIVHYLATGEVLPHWSK